MPSRALATDARGVDLLAFGAALLLALLNLVLALRFGAKAGGNPWYSRSYEWLTPSPPPTHNFPDALEVTRGPYDYHLADEGLVATARRNGDRRNGDGG